jgi:hypothetical protein
MASTRAFAPRRGIAAALLLILAGNGCASFVPAPADPLPVRERVRFQFRTPRDVPMGEITANDVRTVLGEVVSDTGDTLTVSALRAIAASGYETLGPGSSVRVHRDELAGLYVSRLSISRSIGLAAVIAGLTALVGTALKNAGNSGSNGGPPGNGQ